MKFALIHPQPNEYRFDNADYIVNFARVHKMLARGHALVYNIDDPDWLFSPPWDEPSLRAILSNHIHTVAGRYRGKLLAWDVVNEAINAHGQPNGNFWMKNLGKDYIPEAFKLARQADPDALLFYNDYGGEALNSKSDGIYNMVREFKENGIPIDGVGLQMHVRTSTYQYFNPDDIAANIKRLVALGLKVHITEMTIKILEHSQEELEKQASIGSSIFKVFLDTPGCDAFIVWGFTDRFATERGELYYEHILDEEYKPKPAYSSIVKELRKESMKRKKRPFLI